MTLLTAIFLGIVQGLTEFLPISSSGHLSILQNIFFMENPEEGHLFFDVMLHFGTLISVFIMYRQDIAEMIHVFIGLFKKGAGSERKLQKDYRPNTAARLLLLLIIASFPLVLVLFINDYVEQLYYNTAFIGFALIITGILLYISEKIKHGNKTEKTATVMDALAVGLVQVMAVIPGLSRSGVTITTGLFRGFKKEFAVKFSFLMSIPAILGANVFSLADALKQGIEWNLIPQYLLGISFAAVTGCLVIRLVKLITAKNNFGKFSYYCWAVGITVLIVSFII